MTSIEGSYMMSALADQHIRQGIFRIDMSDQIRTEFQKKLRSLNPKETMNYYKEILSCVVGSEGFARNQNIRHAAIGVLPILNLASLDSGIVTDEYICAVDKLTQQMESFPNPTERGSELLDVGQTLSPYLLRTGDTRERLKKSCYALADCMPYEHFYRSPYSTINEFIDCPTKPVDVVDFQSVQSVRTPTEQQINAELTRLRLIDILEADPTQVWSKKVLAAKLGITKDTLTGYLTTLNVSVSRTWRRPRW